MGRVRRVLLNAAIYFVYFFLSCVLVMLIEALFLKLLDRFVLLSYLAQTVIRLVIYSLGVPALVGLAAYAEGYREADAHPGETVVSGLLAVLIPLFCWRSCFISGSSARARFRFWRDCCVTELT